MSILWATLIDDASGGFCHIEAKLPPGADVRAGLVEAKALACTMDCAVQLEINQLLIWILPTTEKKGTP